MARAAMLRAWRRIIRLENYLTRFSVCDDPATGGSRVMGQHCVTIFAAAAVTS